MENYLENTVTSTQSNGSKHRKSIFSHKSKILTQQPTILINGENHQFQQHRTFNSDSNFYPLPLNSSISTPNIFTRTINHLPSRTITQPFVHNPSSRVVIEHTPLPDTKCIRPVSLGRTYVQTLPVYTQPLQGSRILTASRVIPSQTSNIVVEQRKIIQQPPIIIHQNPVQPIQVINITPQPTNSRIIIKQTTVPEVTKIIVKDDPKTISQMNKLTLLNQYLNNQYSLTNNELNLMKQKMYQKEFVEDKVFLERSLNTIDSIFHNQTNSALQKLEELSKVTSTYTRTLTKVCSNKRTKSPSFVRTKTSSNNYSGLTSGAGYSPIKNVEQSRISTIEARH